MMGATRATAPGDSMSRPTTTTRPIRAARAALLALLGLGACKSIDPFQNDAPKVVSVNGLAYQNLFQPATPKLAYYGSDFNVVPGADFAIDVVYDDPENRPIRVWWPNSPEGWEFDPDGTSGVWHVPDPAPPLSEIDGVLEDPVRHDPRTVEFVVPISISGDVDSGLFYP